MLPIPRAPLPEAPKESKWWLKVHRAQTGKWWQLIAMADELYQCWLHWDPDIGRGVPCYGEGVCQFCGPHSVRVWQAYLPVCDVHCRTFCIAEITRGCAQSMARAGLLSQSLYGVQLTLTRKEKKNSKNGAVMLLDHKPSMVNKLPPKIDPLPSLVRLWTWNEEHYGKVKAKMDALRGKGQEEIDRLKWEYGQ